MTKLYSPYTGILSATTSDAPEDLPNSPGYPNLIMHNTFKSVPPIGQFWNDAEAGEWFHVNTGWTDVLSLHSPTGNHADTPRPNGILEGRWPQGLVPGAGSWRVQGWDSINNATEYREIYIAQWVRIHGPSNNFNSFEVGTLGGGKLGWLSAGERPNDNTHFIGWARLAADQGETLVNRLALRLMTQNIHAQNYECGVYDIGEWQLWEMQCVLNDVSTANGKFNFWRNGQLRGEHNNVIWRTEGNEHGFWRWDNNSTWGGTGGPNKTRNDFYDFAEVQAWGIPL